jgi:hypothetical protein
LCCVASFWICSTNSPLNCLHFLFISPCVLPPALFTACLFV